MLRYFYFRHPFKTFTHTAKIALLIILTCFSLASKLSGQVEGEFYRKIAELDSLFFAAQNDCDLEKYKSFLAEDFEFYHDKQGLTKSRESEMKTMAIFCGEQRKRQHLRRELIQGSLKVYPLNNFGAIQTCDHKFYLVIDERTSKLVAKAKLTNVWKFENNEWKLARTFSYDHQPLAQVQLEDNILNSYAGNYAASDRTINIQKQGAILRATDIKAGEMVWSGELLPESENVFYLNYENVQYEFVKEGAEVVRLIIYEQGRPVESINRK